MDGRRLAVECDTEEWCPGHKRHTKEGQGGGEGEVGVV